MAGRGSRPKETKALLCPPDPKYILKAEMGHIHCINFSLPENKNFIKLFTGTEDGELYVWNLTTKKLCLKEKLGSPIITILIYNSTIITQEKEGLIKKYLLEKEQLIPICSTVVVNGGFCKTITIDQLLVVPEDEGIDLYDIETMTISKSLKDKDKKFGMLMCLTKVETSFGLYVLAIYETGDSVLWDINSFSKFGTIKFIQQPISATFNKIKERGVVVGACNQIQIFEVRNLSSGGIHIIYQIETPSDTLTAVRSRPDDLVFVVGGSDGTLRYFSWKTLKLLVVLKEHARPITDILFVPNEKTDSSKTTMVAASADGSLSFWDLY